MVDKITKAQDQAVLIYTTWPDAGMAEAAGAELVSGRIAACVNVLAPATAIYEWNGDVQRDTEYPMIIKTMPRHVAAVTTVVKAHHSYEVPAIVVLPLAGGDAAYLGWIDHQTTSLPAAI